MFVTYCRSVALEVARKLGGSEPALAANLLDLTASCGVKRVRAIGSHRRIIAYLPLAQRSADVSKRLLKDLGGAIEPSESCR